MSTSASAGPREIASGVFWVGSDDASKMPIRCNPYLVVDNQAAVLIDPGSPLDFEAVYHNVLQIVSIEQLKYIVLQHQDPDLCASTPCFEQRGFRGEIVTHWRTVPLVSFYDIKSPFYIINEHQWRLTFGQNRTLEFVAAPYLHFPGSVVSYDTSSKVLFSSDLFGTFGRQVPFYADEWRNCGYIDAMCNFHEHYMPANSILRPVMEKLLRMEISLIAPQHGSVIRQDIPRYIVALRELECGSFLTPIRHELSALDGYTRISTQVLRRYYTVYSIEQIAAILAGSGVKLDQETGVITDFSCSGRELWDGIFAAMYEREGREALMFVEPLVRKLSAEYSIDLPEIFQSAVYRQEQKNLQILQENRRLLEDTTKLTEQLAAASENLLRCPVTGLRNEQVLRQYLDFQQQTLAETQAGGIVLFIGVDNMTKLNVQYGNLVGNEVLRTLAYMIDEAVEGQHALFKTAGPVFACCLANSSQAEALREADAVRTAVAQSDRMIERLTVSVVVVDLAEFVQKQYPEGSDFASTVVSQAKTQLELLRRQGGNRVAVAGEEQQRMAAGKILLVDTDALHLEVLGTILNDAGFSVMTAPDGEAALDMVEKDLPDLIVSEVMLPKTDGFLLRRRLKLNHTFQQIPFILVSFQKNEENIQRAFGLDIEHYFQKPYVLAELLGLIQLKFRQLSVTSS